MGVYHKVRIGECTAKFVYKAPKEEWPLHNIHVDLMRGGKKMAIFSTHDTYVYLDFSSSVDIETFKKFLKLCLYQSQSLFGFPYCLEVVYLDLFKCNRNEAITVSFKEYADIIKSFGFSYKSHSGVYVTFEYCDQELNEGV